MPDDVDPSEDPDTLSTNEQTVFRVLAGFRERRRRRRGEDTYFGSSALFRAAIEDGISVEELDSRRSSILEEAVAEGVPVDLAELLYDIAWEEGLDPAVGFELVRTGLGVAPPVDGVSTTADAPAVDKYLPAWMFPPT